MPREGAKYVGTKSLGAKSLRPFPEDRQRPEMKRPPTEAARVTRVPTATPRSRRGAAQLSRRSGNTDRIWWSGGPGPCAMAPFGAWRRWRASISAARRWRKLFAARRGEPLAHCVLSME